MKFSSIVFGSMMCLACCHAAFLPAVSAAPRSRCRHNRMLVPPHTLLSKTALRGGSTTPTAHSNSVIFDNVPFWQTQKIFGLANALGLAISLATGSHVHLDLLGTGAFALAATVPFSNDAAVLPRVKWCSIAVFIWGAKLSAFLFYRALKIKKDARLADTLSTRCGTLIFWSISWLWGIICSLPYTIGATSSSAGDPFFSKVGGTMYVLGLITETLADYQKWVFKQSNPNQFCNVGLWSLSQHPNFFGNILIWLGIFTINAPALVDSNAESFFARYKRVGLALLSPIFLISIFYGQASGSFSNTVELFEHKYGKNPGFQDYVKSTPLIFPIPFKK